MKKSVKIVGTICLFIMICLSLYGYIYVHENVHLGKYKGLTTKMTTYKVTDGDIQTSLNELVTKYPNKKKVYSGTIKDGQNVYVEYSYQSDGKTIKNSKEVTAGINSIGFEDKLVGTLVGETSKILVKYDDSETNKTFVNKKITFTVTSKYKIKETKSKVTDEFIDKNTEYKTVDEYKEYLKSEFISSYENNAKIEAGNKLIRKILKTSRVRNYPTKEVEKYKKNVRASYKDAASQMGISYKQLLTYMNLTNEEFENDLNNEANFYVSKKLIVKAIAKKHHITISDKEFKEYLKNISDTYSDFDSVKDLQKYIQENKTEDDLRYDALSEKVIDYLLKHNKVKTKEQTIEYRSLSVSI